VQIMKAREARDEKDVACRTLMNAGSFAGARTA
jgi:hypothetical protein